MLCTTCTISYIFGEVAAGESIVSTATMVFKEGGEPVEVNFVSMNLAMVGVDGVTYYWTMDMGLINPTYQNLAYFNFYTENMFGLAPFLSEDTNLLNRQFLFTFKNAAA